MPPDDLELKLGYDKGVADEDATTAAVAEWHAACRREGVTPVGEPTATIHRGEPTHEAMGQFAVVVVGEVADGGQ